MSFVFTTAQRSELELILASSDADRYADAYAKVIEFIEFSAVPGNVLAWFRGGRRR